MLVKPPDFSMFYYDVQYDQYLIDHDDLSTHSTRVFIAGSIEMGNAEPWQDKFNMFGPNKDVLILNPRRDDWDNSIEQSVHNPYFHEQLKWEHLGLTLCDEVFFYFDPNTKSPISLLELGLVSEAGKEVTVCCPQGFWRKGNVDFICLKYKHKMVDSIDEYIDTLI